MIEINRDKCTGCGACIDVCPTESLEIQDNVAVVSPTCTVCGLCISECQFEAIAFPGTISAAKDVKPEGEQIWVFAQEIEGQTLQVVYELLGVARSFTTEKVSFVTALLPGGTREQANVILAYGADRVIIMEGCSPTNEDECAHAVSYLAKLENPDILLIGATLFGRSLAPRVSCLLRTGLTADCTGLEIDQETGLLLQTRPAFGGNLMASIVCPHARPQMATVRPHVFPIPARDEAREGIIESVDTSEIAKRALIHFLEQLYNPSHTHNIQDSEVIIAVGKGIGNAENIALAEALASRLGGTVAATRSVVDAGWLPYDRQVGQTGKTISPKLYIALGISGAIQHVVGIANVDCLIAVNTDSSAPIFEVADYGLVRDCRELVEELLDAYSA